jgi:hypothetical protein
VNYPAKPLHYTTSRVKITAAQAKIAIYLDDEGNKDKVYLKQNRAVWYKSIA